MSETASTFTHLKSVLAEPPDTDLATVLALNGPTQPRPVKTKTLGDAFRLFMGHTSTKALAATAVAGLVARPFLGPPTRKDAQIVLALMAYWPFQEWLAHKYVLHAKPIEVGGITVDPSVARYHRAHHADPWRIDLAFLPAWFIVPASVANPLVWAAITRRKDATATGVAASSLITLGYEWTHFLTHTSYKPKRKWYQRLQRRHRLHHFKHELLWYGFTVPYVDDLLGTAPDPTTVETSPNVRTLGVNNQR